MCSIVCVRTTVPYMRVPVDLPDAKKNGDVMTHSGWLDWCWIVHLRCVWCGGVCEGGARLGPLVLEKLALRTL